jgi:hypothetical protein
MIIDTSLTKENIEKALKSTRELMANPYCDQFMFLSLLEKEEKYEEQLKQLENEFRNTTGRHNINGSV